MISPAGCSVLEVGFNELYCIQQKECIIQGITSLPDVSSLSTFSFILSDTTSSGRLITSTLNLMRRCIPLLPTSFDFIQLYNQIISTTTNDVDFIQVLSYEKIMTLIVLGDYLNDDILIELYSKVLDGYSEVLRLMHASLNEYLFNHLHTKLITNKKIWKFICQVLSTHKMKVTLLRFILEHTQYLDEDSINSLMPILFEMIINYKTEKEYIISEYSHYIICYIIKNYPKESKVYLEQYIYMVITIILSINGETQFKYYNGYNKSIEPMDIRNILYHHLDSLLNQPNFIMSVYINYDCDPHASNLSQFIVENLVKIQLANPTVVPQIRKVLINMLKYIKPGTGNGKELDLKLKKEKDEKIALSFNRNIQSGLELYKKTYFPDQQELTPKQIANFFRNTKGLDKQFIGDFFEKRKEIQIATLKEYLYEFIKDKNILTGFVAFVQSLKLPKETNSINHIFEDYAKYFAEVHPELYSSDDVLFMISAMLLLNVELHHPVMKNKRTKKEFVQAMKEMIPKVNEDIFNTIYDYIDQNEFHIPNEEPSIDISRLKDDFIYRKSIMQEYISDTDYTSKSVDEVVNKIIKPLVQNLQAQFELASTTSALDQACQGFIEFASLAQTLNNTTMADFLANNLIKVSTICQNPDLNTFCYDIKPIRASLLVLELFDKFYSIFNKSIPLICEFMSSLKHLDLFPTIEESKPSELLKLFTPQQTQKQQSSWFSSWLGGESQTEESIQKTKNLFKTKSYSKHIIIEITKQMNDNELKQFINGFYSIISNSEEGNNHSSVSALILLHIIISFNWNRNYLVWNDIVEDIIKQIDKKSDNPLMDYLPLLPLSLMEVHENTSSSVVEETIKLLCVLPDEFIKMNENLIIKIIIKITQTMIQEPKSMNDILNMFIIHTSQTTVLIKQLCTENICLIKDIINNPLFNSSHCNQMKMILCNIYKTIASTTFFKQYIEVLTLFYSKLVMFLKLNDEHKQTIINNFQSISLFFFVACCHPTAEIRQNALTTLQSVTPEFFSTTTGDVVLYFFKSMSQFINSTCSKKRHEISLRCIEMVTKIFLGSHIIILEKNKESWTIIMQIIQKMKENNSINEEIKELIKNMIFVLVCEEKIIKGTEEWNTTFKTVEGILNENDFISSNKERKDEETKEEITSHNQTETEEIKNTN
ncbi:hypothetical protein ENUP19_0370G0029 [Entamoeba nuttalli]|uniref:Sec7 domain containing protein n=2 Tax=Entamoeba nuttalli TaxID=412467 RepID=K2GZ06_ENTNP|nr:Sec7 domain containing protein [Entamoeba nuttalli P19]EKE40488.1 Sec7 domain containing protein [Entamoeba nuttalli P19]|eukprot:XP_008857176.1 Sec7 domain containing protein [Entamoeba nuttalli P19]